MSTNRIETTAYHEAGHAVAAFDLGLPLQYATVIPSGNTDGLVRMADGGVLSRMKPDVSLSPAAKVRLEKHAIVCFAGQAAQRKYAPRSLRAHHGESDRATAADFAAYIVGNPGRAFDAYLRYLWLRAEELVADPDTWTLIGAVAKALIERRRLSGGQIREAIFQAARERATLDA